MTIPEDVIDLLMDAYESGRFADAYRLIESYFPFYGIRDARALDIVARLLSHVGASSTSDFLAIQNYRRHRTNPEAKLHYAITLLSRKGALKGALFLRAEPSNDWSDKQRARWLALRGHVAALFRDNTTADMWIKSAIELQPDDAWIWSELSIIHSLCDRVDEARKAVERCLELQPGNYIGIHLKAADLAQSGHCAEAADLLIESLKTSQDCDAAGLLVHLLISLNRDVEAWAWLDKVDEWTFHPDKDTLRRKYSTCARVAYKLGFRKEALAAAGEVNLGYCKRLLDTWTEDSSHSTARLLEVPHVKQEHNTCGPATLTAISQFWNRPVNHAEVAEEICYNGTPWHSERDWADRNGYLTKEFTVNWESAVALIDRGIPFTITTTGWRYGHLQAVAGYDPLLKTLWLRDPGSFAMLEYPCPELFDWNRSTGPRGLALVPADRADLLAGLELPDTDLWDCQYRLEMHLKAHHRELAYAELDMLKVRAPDSRLSLMAERSLAAYDRNRLVMNRVLEQLAEQYPEDPNLYSARMSTAAELMTRQDMISMLRESVFKIRSRIRSCHMVESDDTFSESTEAYPFVMRTLAAHLVMGAETTQEASIFLHRCARMDPRDPETLSLLAQLALRSQDRELAFFLLHLAVCVAREDSSRYVEDWLTAARLIGREEEVVDLARSWVKTDGSRSGEPVQRLFAILMTLNRAAPAFEALDNAIKLRPEDGALACYAVEQHIAIGQTEFAGELLEAAREHTPIALWLRTSALVHQRSGNLRAALDCLETLLEKDPLDLDLHSSFSLLLEREKGIIAVNDHFQRFHERFPHYSGLIRLWAFRLHSRGEEKIQEAVLREAIAADENDDWAQATLTHLLRSTGRLNEALEMAQALSNRSSVHARSLAALVFAEAGRLEEAARIARSALHDDLDDGTAFAALWSTCSTADDRKAALELLINELEGGISLGPAIETLYRFGLNTLEPDRILEILSKSRERFPNDIEAWTISVEALLDLNYIDEAARIAQQACDLLPLRPEVWISLSRVHRQSGNDAAVASTLQWALTASPCHPEASADLARYYMLKDEPEIALATIERALAINLDHEGLQALKETVLWKSGRTAEAFSSARKRAANSGADEAWQQLRQWYGAINRTDEYLKFAEECLNARPFDHWITIRVAEALCEAGRPREIVAGLSQLIKDAPYNISLRLAALELMLENDLAEEALALAEWQGEGTMPPALKDVRARALSATGQTDRAIQAMRDLVTDQPDLVSPQLNLIGMLTAQGEQVEAEAMCRQFIKRHPTQSAGYGYLAESLYNQGRRSECKEVLKYAFDNDPTYSYAGHRYFMLLLKDEEWQEALRIARKMAAISEDGRACTLGIQWAVHHKDLAVASEMLTLLCRPGAIIVEPLLEACERLIGAGMHEAVLDALEPVIFNSTTPVEIGGVFAIASYIQRPLYIAHVLDRLQAYGEIGARAAGTMARHFAETGKRDELSRLLTERQAIIRRSNHAWAESVHAMMMLESSETTIDWAHDWELRTGMEPWMLQDLAFAFRALCREGESARVSRKALESQITRGDRLHRLFLAFDAAVEGHHSIAKSLMSGVSPSSNDEFYVYQMLNLVVPAMLNLHDTALTRSEAFKQAKTAVRKAIGILGGHRSAVGRKTINLTVKRITDDVGTLSAKIWGMTTKV